MYRESTAYPRSMHFVSCRGMTMMEALFGTAPMYPRVHILILWSLLDILMHVWELDV